MEQEHNPKSDLSLLTGDFNVLRHPLWEGFYNKKVAQNPAFKEPLDEANTEYGSTLLKILKDDPLFNFTDLVE